MNQENYEYSPKVQKFLDKLREYHNPKRYCPLCSRDWLAHSNCSLCKAKICPSYGSFEIPFYVHDTGHKKDLKNSKNQKFQECDRCAKKVCLSCIHTCLECNLNICEECYPKNLDINIISDNESIKCHFCKSPRCNRCIFKCDKCNRYICPLCISSFHTTLCPNCFMT